jgi:hypothetical protein
MQVLYPLHLDPNFLATTFALLHERTKEPSMLPQIQLLLSENVLETFMIGVNVTSLTIKVMPPRL